MNLHRHVCLPGAILLFTCGATAQSHKKADSPDLQEIRGYRLSMDVVERYVKAAQSAVNDAAAKKCFENDSPGSAPTLDAGEKVLNSCPAAVAHLNAAGLKPREFLIVTVALIGDFMAVTMKKNGAIKEYPASISPENAAFVEQNYEKLQALLAPVTGSANK
jgi:hypothetical protein